MRYRHSILKEPDGEKWIVLSATFELETGDPRVLEAQLEKNLEGRKTTQPQNVGSAGCIFKNYEVTSKDEMKILDEKLDIPDAMKKSGRLSAGWIIEELDLKGKKIGGASVSEVHGNFLVNDGTATADHVIQLIALIKTRARNELGIQLEEEVHYVA